MARKLYEAYVLDKEDLPEYFEKGCSEHDVTIIEKEPYFSFEHGFVTHYIVEAEEGTIQPKYEYKKEI